MAGELRARAESALRGVTAALDGDVAVETDALVDEDPADVLIRVSENVDLLVCGSAPTGRCAPCHWEACRARLAADARCPVIVLPRGVPDSLTPLMAEAPGAAAAG